MGNIIGGLPANSAFDQQGAGPELNDPNHSHLGQMIGILFNGVMPMAGICFLACIVKKHETEAVEKVATASGELLIKLEREEDKVRTAKLHELKFYDDSLEKILDVRCSWIKHKEGRIPLEDTLVKRLNTLGSPLQGLDMKRGLNEVFEYDYLHCGNNKEENGKLRQLYLEQWRLKVELQRYKNIVEKLKDGLGMMSGNEPKKD